MIKIYFFFQTALSVVWTTKEETIMMTGKLSILLWKQKWLKNTTKYFYLQVSKNVTVDDDLTP